MIFTAKKVQQKLKTFLPALVISLALTSCETSSTTKTQVEITYQFHSTVTYLPEGTNGTAGTTATYCYFGDWPQTIKASNIAVYENQSISMGRNTYYLGSDNNYYAKCTEDPYNPTCTYSDGTSVNKNATAYFKVEPIKWRILNPNAKNGEKILLAEKALCGNFDFYYYCNINRTINETTVYPNNYKHSAIRAYLNGLSYEYKFNKDSEQKTNSYSLNNGFFQTAFTPSAQDIILDTTIDNSAESTNPASNPTQWNDGENQYTCNTTKDKIFLLSEKEVTSSDYGFAEYNVYINDENSTAKSSRLREPTDYAIANFIYCKTMNATYTVNWWLRSPSFENENVVQSIKNDGNAKYKLSVDSEFGAIVPALSISTN